MKYRRLKTIAGDGTIMRYYELADEAEALCNVFYGVTDNKVSKIEGAVGEGVKLIGFSHGGDNLAKGLIFLDINPAVVYMGIFEDGEDTRPEIGDVVNGYQRVIDTHYDNDEASGKGKKPEEWGIEDLDNPYYLFTILQPTGSEATVDDSGAGEESGTGYDPEPVWEYDVSIYIASVGGTGVLHYKTKEEGATEQTLTMTYGGDKFKFVVKDGETIADKYAILAMYDAENEGQVVDLVNVPVKGNTTIPVAVPTVTP